MAACRGQPCLPRLQNRPACPQARMRRDQHTLRTAGPGGSQSPTHQSSVSSVELHPMVEPMQRPQVPKPLWNLSGWMAGGLGDTGRPELEAALLWGGLWGCPRTPVLPTGLPDPARSEKSPQGHRAWHPLLGTPVGSSPPLFTPQCVMCTQFSTAKFPHLDLQPPE